MDTIFKKDSWTIETAMISSKNFNTKKIANESRYLTVTKLKYLNPIFFDEEVRIDIELSGSMYLEINNKKHVINTNMKNEEKCILVKNGVFSCDGEESGIDTNTSNELKLVIEENTLIKRFTIIQNMKIDNCNPNN